MGRAIYMILKNKKKRSCKAAGEEMLEKIRVLSGRDRLRVPSLPAR